MCSAAAFSLFSNGILAAPLAHHSSASAPDFHRLPLFSPRQSGPQSLYSVVRFLPEQAQSGNKYAPSISPHRSTEWFATTNAYLEQKKRPHRQTKCLCDRLFSLPAFLPPVSGCALAFNMVGILARASRLTPSPLPRLLSFPMTGFRRRTAISALTATVIQEAPRLPRGTNPRSLVYRRA